MSLSICVNLRNLRIPIASLRLSGMKDKSETTSHVEALKSTSIIGGSTAIVILIRMVRTKVLAILLGPAGIGLEAMYDSIISLARIGVDLGISSSGRSPDRVRSRLRGQTTIATTVFTLRRVCLILGIVGAAVLFLLREQVSKLTFGTLITPLTWGCCP